MVRTKREHALSWLGLIIIFGTTGIIALVFGPNALTNPFLIGFFIIFSIFILCWLFGYIKPANMIRKRKKMKTYKYIKEAPATRSIDSTKTINLEDDITCPYCGVIQEKNTKFCTKCGQKIESL